MPIELDHAAVKETARKHLYDAAFKKAVEAEKVAIKVRSTHFLPWKIKFQSPIKLIDWKDIKHWHK